MKLFALVGLLLVLGASAQNQQQDTKPLFSDKDSVFTLTNENFKTLVTDTQDFWVIKFYAPWCGHCQKLAPEFAAAAKKLLGSAKLGVVDCTVEEELAAVYEIASYPTLKVFAKGGESNPGTDYDGERTTEGLVDWIRKATGEEDGKEEVNKLVTNLKYLETFTFLYQVYPEIPKGILFTTGETAGFIPGWYTTLAGKYKSGKDKKAAFGLASLDDEDGQKIAKRFEVDEPTLIIVAPDGENKGWYVIMDETLGSKGSANTKNAQEIINEVLKGEILEDEKIPVPAFPEPSKPREVAKAYFYEATAENIEKKCYKNGKKNICIMALVGAVDVKDRVVGGDNAFTEFPDVNDLSKKYRNDPIAFVWVDAPKQDEFLQAFGLAWEGTSKMIAVKTGKRNRYAVMEGELSSDNMNTFVDKILGGDMQFKVLKALPDLVPDYMMNMNMEE